MRWVFEYGYESKLDNCINWFKFYNDDVIRPPKPSEKYALFYNNVGNEVSTCFSYKDKKHFMQKIRRVRYDLSSKNLKCSKLGLKSFDVLLDKLMDKHPEAMV